MTTHERKTARLRRQKRVRRKLLGTEERPRICVFRSKKHVYAQVISDQRGVTLLSVSTLSKGLADKFKSSRGVEAARQVGLAVAQRCKERDIKSVVFDRNGFLYHGRVKAVADGAREGGLEF